MPPLLTPQKFADPQPTATSWVFAVDQACLRAFTRILLGSRSFSARGQPVERWAMRALAAAGPHGGSRLRTARHHLHAAQKGLARLDDRVRRYHAVACINTLSIVGGGSPTGP